MLKSRPYLTFLKPNPKVLFLRRYPNCYSLTQGAAPLGNPGTSSLTTLLKSNPKVHTLIMDPKVHVAETEIEILRYASYVCVSVSGW